MIVNDVGFTIRQGEVLALIGESGSGKTTIALALMGYAAAAAASPAARSMSSGARSWRSTARPCAGCAAAQIAYIAQSAAAAFNPSRSDHGAGDRERADPRHHDRRRGPQPRRVELFRELALPDPERIGDRYPHQVSGGQLQRLMAAMALINDPELVIFDEPTTALDVTTQIEVLRAFKAVVRTRKTTGIYVSHDLAVVAQIADRIVVLRHGRLQETGPTERL